MKSHYRDGEYGRAVECYDADEVDAQIATLTARIADLEARDIHTCHDQCERPLCVANRRIAELEVERYRAVLAIRLALGADHDGVGAMRFHLERVVRHYGVATECQARAALTETAAQSVEMAIFDGHAPADRERQS